jgi:hypothetical protein
MKPLRILRELFFAWAFAALLPLPVLLATSPARHADVKCLYLGLASAWFASEAFYGKSRQVSASAGSETAPTNESPGSQTPATNWRDTVLAVVIALVANVSLFILLGLSIDIESHFPFPLMAALSAVPALGMVPWLSQRVPQQYAALVLGATLVALFKLAACVVARVVYGPNFLEDGYVAGDWRTAKLMISVFWGITTTASAGMLWMSFRRERRAGSGAAN